MSKTLWIIGSAIGVTVALIVLAQWWGKPLTAEVAAGPSTLSAEPASYDFGTVSMAAGKVRQRFTVKNTGQSTVRISRLTTSCMCTTASLVIGDKTVGPYGMPGHGFVPRLNESLPAGGTATLEVQFDPAAHGPSGVGPVNRAVTLEQEGGAPLVVSFRANVSP